MLTSVDIVLREDLAATYDPVAGSRILFDRFADQAAVRCTVWRDCACRQLPEEKQTLHAPCLPLFMLREAPRLAA
jgi:hypothetical protein